MACVPITYTERPSPSHTIGVLIVGIYLSFYSILKNSYSMSFVILNYTQYLLKIADSFRLSIEDSRVHAGYLLEIAEFILVIS